MLAKGVNPNITERYNKGKGNDIVKSLNEL